MITINDIAEKAGVSRSTASYVLSRQSAAKRISAATQQRVMDVAEELRYRPNLLVRGMQTGKTGVVGVVMPVRETFYAGIIEGIHDELAAAASVPIVLWGAADARSKRGPSTLDQIHRLVDRRVDAIIMRPAEETAHDHWLHEVVDRGLPLVCVDRELDLEGAAFCGTDDDLGGRLAARHLLKLGHRVLGHLAGPEFASNARQRRVGFESEARKAGATCLTLGMAFGADAKFAREMLRAKPRPTAIFAASDNVAQGVYAACEALKLRIPEDVSVVGFADLPFASWMRPALTTLGQQPYDIGRTAARMALESEARRDVRFAPELIERASTAPPQS